MISVAEAKVYRLNGQYDKAIETLNASSRSENPEFKFEKARCYRLKKEYTEALNILESCEWKGGLYELAILHYEMGDMNKAILYMDQFINDYEDPDPEYVKINKAMEFVNKWKNQS